MFFEDFFCGAGVLTFAQDENALIWYSGREEKKLWLSTVSRIIPGQRTVSIITQVLHNASPYVGSYCGGDKYSILYTFGMIDVADLEMCGMACIGLQTRVKSTAFSLFWVDSCSGC